MGRKGEKRDERQKDGIGGGGGVGGGILGERWRAESTD